MTSKQRKQYLTIYAIMEMAKGMQEHKQEFERKTVGSLERIVGRCKSMLDELGTPTYTDAKYFLNAADRLKTTGSVFDGTRHTPAAYVTIMLTLIADQVNLIPKEAVHVRKKYTDLEGMIATLYGHFDPDFEDGNASREGEEVANEYRQITMGC